MNIDINKIDAVLNSLSFIRDNLQSHGETAISQEKVYSINVPKDSIIPNGDLRSALGDCISMIKDMKYGHKCFREKEAADQRDSSIRVLEDLNARLPLLIPKVKEIIPSQNGARIRFYPDLKDYTDPDAIKVLKEHETSEIQRKLDNQGQRLTDVFPNPFKGGD